MARVSKFLYDENPFPKGFGTCLFCSEPHHKGGFWVGEETVSVCPMCEEHLMAFLVDTLEDSWESFRDSSNSDKAKYIGDMALSVIRHKKTIRKKVKQ